VLAASAVLLNQTFNSQIGGLGVAKSSLAYNTASVVSSNHSKHTGAASEKNFRPQRGSFAKGESVA
jgi:hypothetical protein